MFDFWVIFEQLDNEHAYSKLMLSPKWCTVLNSTFLFRSLMVCVSVLPINVLLMLVNCILSFENEQNKLFATPLMSYFLYIVGRDNQKVALVRVTCIVLNGQYQPRPILEFKGSTRHEQKSHPTLVTPVQLILRNLNRTLRFLTSCWRFFRISDNGISSDLDNFYFFYFSE